MLLLVFYPGMARMVHHETGQTFVLKCPLRAPLESFNGGEVRGLFRTTQPEYPSQCANITENGRVAEPAVRKKRPASSAQRSDSDIEDYHTRPCQCFLSVPENMPRR